MNHPTKTALPSSSPLPKMESELYQEVQNYQENLFELNHLVKEMENHKNRLCGTYESEVIDDSPQPVPFGYLNQLSSMNGEFKWKVNKIYQLLDQLNKAV